ncbi:MAG: hypothetical protein ACRET4_00180, partial [Steroidobacteraceae bacterium]
MQVNRYGTRFMKRLESVRRRKLALASSAASQEAGAMQLIDRILAGVDFAAWGAPLASALRILAIVLAAAIARRASSKLIRSFRERVSARMTEGEQIRRAETLGRIFRYLAVVIITLIAGV